MTATRLFATLVLIAGVLAIVVVSVAGDSRTPSGRSTSADEASDAGTPDADDEPLEPIPVLGKAGTLTGLDGWLNTEADSFEEIRAANELVIVQFWTFGCFNCKNTLGALGEIYEKYKDQGVEIIGVHAPEFAHEAEVDNIVAAAADLNVTWPIALDTEKRNFHRWQEGPTGYWPRVYLIDSEGQIRLDRRGDGLDNYRRLSQYVERLLAGEA